MQTGLITSAARCTARTLVCMRSSARWRARVAPRARRRRLRGEHVSEASRSYRRVYPEYRVYTLMNIAQTHLCEAKYARRCRWQVVACEAAVGETVKKSPTAEMK